MGLPSVQSESTVAAKKYLLAAAALTSAPHTAVLDALMATEALETCSLSILDSPSTWMLRARSCRGSGRRRVARRRHKARVEELEYYQAISSRTILITIRPERVGRAQEFTQLAKPKSQNGGSQGVTHGCVRQRRRIVLHDPRHRVSMHRALHSRHG